jgi:hypothetical protein
MATVRLEPTDSLFIRIWGYLLERFPPVAYTVLVALFAGSTFLLADAQASWSVGFMAGLVVLLVFFHLRIMDEHKDGEADRQAYPDRLLTRGVVTLPLLKRLGLIAVVAQAVLAWVISVPAFQAWLACLVFTVLMRVEFGVGRWLNRHLIVYAITHNPIVGLLAAFLWVVAGGTWSLTAALYVAVVSLGSLAFEIGRKIRLPNEEIRGVESYSSVLGKSRADALLLGIRWVTSGLLFWLAYTVGMPAAGAVALGLSVAWTALLVGGRRSAKATEGVATGALLLDFILIGSLGW